MDDLIGEFISETSESLAALERTLGDHARQPMTRDGWNMAYRLMHTIKGTCGFLRFANMEAVAAQSETMLQHVRDSNHAPSDTELAALRTSMAQISYMMDHLATHGSEPAVPAPPPPVSTFVAEQLSEQLHPASTSPLPTLSAPPKAMIIAEPRAEERISHATLTSLVQVRNRLAHRLGAQDADTRALHALISQLKDALLPRASAFPRLAEMLLVQSGTMRFAIEQSAVREVVRIATHQRPAILEEGAMISLRGAWLPRVSLAQWLNHGSSAGEAYAVLIDMDGQRLALCVERLDGLTQLMLQPVPRLLRSIPAYSAAAILGDGSPCLILAAQAMLQHIATPEVAPEAPPPAASPPETDDAATPLLLFHDGAAKAVPLVAVARVEPIDRAALAVVGDGYEIMLRGECIRLQMLPGSTLPDTGELRAILWLDAPTTGVLVHRVGGIVDVTGAITSDRSIIISGTPTRVIDVPTHTARADG